MADPTVDVAGRYGPWALIAGASEGVGAAFALEVARRGVGVVLLARRRAALEELAGQIRAETDAEALPLAVDLAEPTAMATVAEATAHLDVGLVFYCAGADPHFRPFLDAPVATASAMVHRNCVVPMQMAHHFAGPMVERGRGGIVVVSSMAGLVGGPNMVAYGASKAFDMVFAEALWAELHEQGVDVLSLVLGETDTPALRRLRAERGVHDDPDAPLPGAATVAEVVRDAIEQLPHGPSRIVGEHLREGAKLLGGISRNEAVGFMVEASADAMSAPGQQEDS